MIRTAITVTALAAGAMALTACALFQGRASVEQPSYAVVDRIGRSVEVRQYPALVAAEVSVPAGRGARDRAFRVLFDYIRGNNRPAQSIAMTTPVEITAGRRIAMTAPVETREGAETLVMRFFLPADIAADAAPEPLDERVSLVRLPPQSQAVLRFSGAHGAGVLDTRQRLLVATVDGSPGWAVDGSPTAYLYDPPWTPGPLRRNEVVVPVVAKPGTAAEAATP